MGVVCGTAGYCWHNVSICWVRSEHCQSALQRTSRGTGRGTGMGRIGSLCPPVPVETPPPPPCTAPLGGCHFSQQSTAPLALKKFSSGYNAAVVERSDLGLCAPPPPLQHHGLVPSPPPPSSRGWGNRRAFLGKSPWVPGGTSLRDVPTLPSIARRFYPQRSHTSFAHLQPCVVLGPQCRPTHKVRGMGLGTATGTVMGANGSTTSPFPPARAPRPRSRTETNHRMIPYFIHKTSIRR